jgi:hypothetical protein
MSKTYPPPPVRPRVTPGKGVPMRQWASASYDPSNGRASAATRGPNPGAYTIEGEHCAPNAQGPDGGFHLLDKKRTQGKTGIKQRPYG